MNALKIANVITNTANRLAYKLLAWRWKANLMRAEASITASKAAKRAAELLEQDADKQLAESQALLTAAVKLKG